MNAMIEHEHHCPTCNVVTFRSCSANCQDIHTENFPSGLHRCTWTYDARSCPSCAQLAADSPEAACDTYGPDSPQAQAVHPERSLSWHCHNCNQDIPGQRDGHFCQECLDVLALSEPAYIQRDIDSPDGPDSPQAQAAHPDRKPSRIEQCLFDLAQMRLAQIDLICRTVTALNNMEDRARPRVRSTDTKETDRMNAYATLSARDQQSALEDLLDAIASPEDLLAMLRNVCYEKAEHVRSTWGASALGTAKLWDRTADSLDRECDRLKAKIGNPYASVLYRSSPKWRTTTLKESDAGYLDAFFRQYLETALWSSTDESTESGGEPMDQNYSVDDIPEDVQERLREECRHFITDNEADLADIDPGQAGHDFWLTRNRHGAGFWDRGLGEIGRRLTDAAHAWGSVEPYVSDDGKVYAFGYEAEVK